MVLQPDIDHCLIANLEARVLDLSAAHDCAAATLYCLVCENNDSTVGRYFESGYLHGFMANWGHRLLQQFCKTISTARTRYSQKEM